MSALPGTSNGGPKSRPMAKYALPGAFMSEQESVELPERSIDAALELAPAHAFAFEMYDSPICDFEFPADRFRLLPIPQNESGKHYIGGKVYTCDELRALAAFEGDPKKYDILISNVTRGYGETAAEGRAIKCRTGNWQPFEDGDVLVEVPNVAPH